MTETRYIPRAYRGVEDLPKILQAIGQWNARTDGCGYLHPGDVRHFLSNGMRGRNPTEHLFLLEAADGELLALVLLYQPKQEGYFLVVHPDQRGSDLESALVTWSEQQTWTRMQAAGIDSDSVGMDLMDCDLTGHQLFTQNGYVPGEITLIYTTRSLLDPIPESVLPEGFSIRAAAGEHEADLLGEVHSSAFDSNWQPGEYLQVMQSPAFAIDHELVVVAPDGSFAAFLIYWVDPVAQTALFEPVGCHADFQRQGLTRALMYEGMRRMRAEGATVAVVLHETAEENPASGALYKAVGFTPKYTIMDYRKKMK